MVTFNAVPGGVKEAQLLETVLSPVQFTLSFFCFCLLVIKYFICRDKIFLRWCHTKRVSLKGLRKVGSKVIRLVFSPL